MIGGVSGIVLNGLSNALVDYLKKVLLKLTLDMLKTHST